MALRGRGFSDWVLAGLFFGFSLYFYAAGKLIIPLLAAFGLYGLLRWRLDLVRRAGAGFLLLGLAFGLAFLPYALFSIRDNWQAFSGRAQETSIFSPQNQAATFARHEVPYDELWMRAAGDGRRDDLVKAELFDRHVRHRLAVRVSLDDRDRVVAVWRRMGLPTWQVNYGNF